MKKVLDAMIMLGFLSASGFQADKCYRMGRGRVGGDQFPARVKQPVILAQGDMVVDARKGLMALF